MPVRSTGFSLVSLFINYKLYNFDGDFSIRLFLPTSLLKIYRKTNIFREKKNSGKNSRKKNSRKRQLVVGLVSNVMGKRGERDHGVGPTSFSGNDELAGINGSAME